MPAQSGSAETPFYFLSGNGNDFIALTGPSPLPSAEEVVGWCRRGVSLGADGVLHLERVAHRSVRLRYWNADGGRSDFCFNGTRAAAQLANQLGWCEGNTVDIVTDAGSFHASIISAFEVEIEAPIPPTPKHIELEELAPEDAPLEPGLIDCRAFFVIVGVPHLVLVLPAEGTGDRLEQLNVELIGARLRHHIRFPRGANVNFVRYADNRAQMQIRTFERGVEAETLACGSGVVASAWVGLAEQLLALPAAVTTRGGFAMQLYGKSLADQRVTEWRLRGDARVVARGTLHPAALRHTRSPDSVD